MCALLIESDTSTFGDMRSNPLLRYLHEYCLSTRNKMTRAHEYSNASDHPILSVSDADSEYKDIIDLSEQVKNMYSTMLASHYDELMHIEISQEQPAWRTHLKDATTVENIVLVIRLFGQSSIANRLNYLHSLPVDESYQKPMNLESVRGFALFIMHRAYLPYPDITVNADGRVTVEWDVAGRGTLILDFLSSEYVEYLEVFQQYKLVQRRKYNTGVSSIDDIMDTVKLWPYTR